MAKRKKYTPFVTDMEGKKYVDVAAIMSPLIPLLDGLTVIHFKGDKKTYLHLDDAIKWVAEEMQHHSRPKYEKMLAVLNRFKEGRDLQPNE